MASAATKPRDPAISGRAVRGFLAAPFRARTWKATAFLLLNLVTGNFWFGIITNGVVIGVATAIVWVGLIVLAVLPLIVRAGGWIERDLTRALLGVEIPEPHRSSPEGSLLRRGRTLVADPAMWKELAYLVLLFPLGLVWGVVAITGWVTVLALVFGPLYYWAVPEADVLLQLPWVLLGSAAGLLLAVLVAHLVQGMASLQGRIARALLGPSQARLLAQQAEDLRTSRARTVDAAAAERRRIERDLHDGAQQRLVSLAMDLGRAREKFDTEPGVAQTLVGEAHVEAKRALAELRDLARGIHPAVLSDQGLDAAVSALAGRCPVPVEVDIDLTQRPPAAVETIAYYLVVEALTNVAKYARADQAWVAVSLVGERMLVEIRDDGVGGAAMVPGGGLAGLADRVAGVDGTLELLSPSGGPTIVRAVLPCAW